ncbi:hypothetical protein BKA67DRAFT_655648 [Truncatella angustata]|uniref:Cyanovirin-N domain-containing protein n=1 Tax=Truncatella angustata TaxID=152316 RepID=A0A9P8US63_9PEZI|nr:uncharacterized protein BKA67DRAFT_655648 [Truncatella angustata]KAH6657374.1 hypothetical protein BKA67DRAFT_655648 [Truncatella angustata]KAH8197425.1 hypothetical protein TruAng_008402 [Truncatella angustata]
MKMLFSLTFAIVAATGILASPYLEFCSLLDIQNVGAQGVVIQASCNGRCEQLNIVPCFANSYGTVLPAGLTNGNFNTTCRDCVLGLTKNDTETYGYASCICASGAPDVVVNTTFNTADAIRYETTLGMACPYGNNSAIRSVQCGTTALKHSSILFNKRDRKVRRSMRSVQLWKP